jgi:hypothetical protein
MDYSNYKQNGSNFQVYFVELSWFFYKLKNFRWRSLRWLEVARGLPSDVFKMVERRRVNKTPGLPRPGWLQIMTVSISNPDDIVSVLRGREFIPNFISKLHAKYGSSNIFR